jgi:hypothetical protein
MQIRMSFFIWLSHKDIKVAMLTALTNGTFPIIKPRADVRTRYDGIRRGASLMQAAIVTRVSRLFWSRACPSQD